MMVARNCLKQIKNNYDLTDLKKIIKENVYTNIYKLLQAI